MNPFDNTQSGSPFDGDERVFFHPLYIDTPADAELHIEVAYGATEADQNPSDNRDSVSISHLENPPASFTVEAPIAILIHPDEPATLRIRLTQAANAFPRDAQLVIELPDQVVVTAAQAVRQDEQSWGEDTVVACNITENVICAAPGIETDISYAVELQLLATAQSAAPIRLSLANVDLDAGDPIVKRDIHVEQVRSMCIIQTLLNNTIHHWGASTSGTCNRLLEITTHSAVVHLQHNVFAHNDCGEFEALASDVAKPALGECGQHHG